MRNLGVLLLLALLNLVGRAQDSIVVRQTALRDDYVNKVKALGLTPSLVPPPVVVSNPPSWGNYDDSANIIETCNWQTLPQEGKAVFENFAVMHGDGMTGERFFQLSVYQWIFVHEVSHWWRKCQHMESSHYEEEKAANRLATAYWRDRDPAFYQFMLSVFKGVLAHRPSPVPAGVSKESYFNEHYNNLPGGPAYSWYQSVMIVEVSEETPALSFAQAVRSGGKL